MRSPSRPDGGQGGERSVLGKEGEEIGPLHSGGLEGDAQAAKEPDGEENGEDALHQAHAGAGEAVHAAKDRELQGKVQDLREELQQKQEDHEAQKEEEGPDGGLRHALDHGGGHGDAGIPDLAHGLVPQAPEELLIHTNGPEEALDLADVIIFMDHGKIVQMAPPEEMLAHPASGQIQDFLGKFIDTHAQKELTAADFMRPGVSTVSATRGVNECVSKMQRRNVDTLIVVDDQDRYQGTVSIADIRLTGHVVNTIEPLIRCNTPTVHTGDSAKDCFDLLISSGAPYLIVLDEEEKVDGLITKTSMTSAMAEQLWG